MSGKMLAKRTHKQKRSDLVLANYQYQGDNAIATYVQDEAAILAANQRDRESTPGKFEHYDLDMGFKFASIPKVLWLKIQALGIQDDTNAIIRFLQTEKALSGRNYFTTTKRLL